MKTKLFLSSLAVAIALLTACHHGITIHPAQITDELKQEYSDGLRGLYDTQLRIKSSAEDSTLRLNATMLDYAGGMKLIVHDFPLSTIAAVLPDSLADLRTAIAAMPDQELTIAYGFSLWTGTLSLEFAPQELPFTCYTADGRQHRLRLRFKCHNSITLSEEEGNLHAVNLVLDDSAVTFSASSLYEDDRLLLDFDTWQNSSAWYYAFLRFVARA